MFDIEPATRQLSNLIFAVRDDQLTDPTPCAETTVGGLLHHVEGFSIAFTAAATKTPLPAGNRGPLADASRLGTDWRTRIPDRLAELARAWAEEDAWTGMTQAGGQELPAELAGRIALDEVVVHGWDVAVSTDQSFDCEPPLVSLAYEFVQPTVMQNPEGTPGLFGRPVPIGGDVPLLQQLLALTGRDPVWRANRATP